MHLLSSSRLGASGGQRRGLVNPVLFSTDSDTSRVSNKNVFILVPEFLNVSERKKSGSSKIRKSEIKEKWFSRGKHEFNFDCEVSADQ